MGFLSGLNWHLWTHLKGGSVLTLAYLDLVQQGLEFVVLTWGPD